MMEPPPLPIQPVRRRKSRRWIALVIIGVALVGLVLLCAVGALFFRGAAMPRSLVIELDLEGDVAPWTPEDLLAKLFGGRKLSVEDVVEMLARAKNDSRVRAVFARVGNNDLGFADVQEIRDAVRDFRMSGKPAIAFAETLGEFGSGNQSTYLAAAFDRIFLQPTGDVGFNGLAAEAQFFKGTLDKLGVVPRGDHRYEYKNALNTFTETGFTEAHREATTALLESLFDQIVTGIAEGRGLSPNEVRRYADEGPFIGQEAVDRKLVDGLAYRDEAIGQVWQTIGQQATLYPALRYFEGTTTPLQKGPGIAVIHAVGAVGRGKSKHNPFSGETSMGSDTVAQAIREAVRDGEVKAILLRVDSPGGSVVASDTIWHETVRARKANKPVIVSMGNVAASGGYYVSMSADKIVAQPGTITGSIGVLSMKLLTEGLWSKLGISFDEVHTSRNSRMWSSLADFTPEGWAKFQLMLDRVYDDFTSKVAEGRQMPKEKVMEVAKGRVWSGRDARDRGLVDELGGMPTAVRLAKEAIGLTADDPVKMMPFPRAKKWRDFFRQEEEPNDVAGRVLEAMEEAKPLLELARRINADPRDEVLTMPPVKVSK
jgi:protease-4